MPIKFNKETSTRLFRYVKSVDIKFNRTYININCEWVVCHGRCVVNGWLVAPVRWLSFDVVVVVVVGSCGKMDHIFYGRFACSDVPRFVHIRSYTRSDGDGTIYRWFDYGLVDMDCISNEFICRPFLLFPCSTLFCVTSLSIVSFLNLSLTVLHVRGVAKQTRKHT